MTEGAGDDLVQVAREAAKHAHAPYSGFAVGAALKGCGGVFAGANVENASYGVTMCAERVALGAAVAAGCTTFERLAVVVAGPEPPTPCGACLQALAEFAPDLALTLVGDEGDRHATVGELLPEPFRLPDR